VRVSQGHDWSRPDTTGPDPSDRPTCSMPPTTRASSQTPGASHMSRYTAPLGFTLAALWVVAVFVMISAGTH